MCYEEPFIPTGLDLRLSTSCRNIHITMKKVFVWPPRFILIHNLRRVLVRAYVMTCPIIAPVRSVTCINLSSYTDLTFHVAVAADTHKSLCSYCSTRIVLAHQLQAFLQTQILLATVNTIIRVYIISNRLYTCMYVCMYVYINACMYVCIYELMYVCIYERMYVYMYIWTHVRMYVCMYI